MGTHGEVRCASLVAAAGLIWTAKVVSDNFTGVDTFSFARLPRGPLELCAIGIVIWLHAVWRRSLRVH